MDKPKNKSKQLDLQFDGPAYVPELDQARLTGQALRIFELMKDARWRTHGEINRHTHDPEASISAQLRHFRKDKFGNHTVYSRYRGDRKKGLYEYQLIVNPDAEIILG